MRKLPAAPLGQSPSFRLRREFLSLTSRPRQESFPVFRFFRLAKGNKVNRLFDGWQLFQKIGKVFAGSAALVAILRVLGKFPFFCFSLS